MTLPLLEEKQKSEEEMKAKNAEILELKSQWSASRNHFEACLAEQNQTISSLQIEVLFEKINVFG